MTATKTTRRTNPRKRQFTIDDVLDCGLRGGHVDGLHDARHRASRQPLCGSPKPDAVARVEEWIRACCEPKPGNVSSFRIHKTLLGWGGADSIGSYGWKHIAEDRAVGLGAYVSNGEFIAATIRAGYRATAGADDLNCDINIRPRIFAAPIANGRARWPYGTLPSGGLMVLAALLSPDALLRPESFVGERGWSPVEGNPHQTATVQHRMRQWQKPGTDAVGILSALENELLGMAATFLTERGWTDDGASALARHNPAELMFDRWFRDPNHPTAPAINVVTALKIATHRDGRL